MNLQEPRLDWPGGQPPIESSARIEATIESRVLPVKPPVSYGGGALADLKQWFDANWTPIRFNCAYIEPYGVCYDAWKAHPEDFPAGPLGDLHPEDRTIENMPCKRLVGVTFAWGLHVGLELIEDYGPGVMNSGALALCETAKRAFGDFAPGGRMYWRRDPVIEIYDDEDGFRGRYRLLQLYFRCNHETQTLRGNKPEGSIAMHADIYFDHEQRKFVVRT